MIQVGPDVATTDIDRERLAGAAQRNFGAASVQSSRRKAPPIGSLIRGQRRR